MLYSPQPSSRFDTAAPTPTRTPLAESAADEEPTALGTWAVAAVAVVDVSGSPLLLRTYTSPTHVLESPEAPQQAHLYVGPEDLIKIHFLLFASLDRCEELWQASTARMRTAAAARQATVSAASVSRTTRSGSQRSSASAGAGAKTTTAAVPAAGGDAGSAGRRTGGASALTAVPPSDPSSRAPSALPQTRLVTSTTDVRFMGRLIQGSRFLSYGFCSATGIRTLLVTVGADAPQDAVLPLCRAVYEAASAALCNPFRTPAYSWRAEQALLSRSYRELAEQCAQLQQQQQLGGNGAADFALWNDSRPEPSFRRVPAQQEFSWPLSPAPSPTSSYHQHHRQQQPTLALSATFNAQLQTILSTFTVSTQSCIMH